MPFSRDVPHFFKLYISRRQNKQNRIFRLQDTNWLDIENVISRKFIMNRNDRTIKI